MFVCKGHFLFEVIKYCFFVVTGNLRKKKKKIFKHKRQKRMGIFVRVLHKTEIWSFKPLYKIDKLQKKKINI